MNDRKRLRVLEGLGYASAMMVAVGGVLDQQVLRLIHLFGLVFAVIAIVRLMVMNVRLGQAAMLFDSSNSMDMELPDFDETEFSDDSQQYHHDRQYQT